MQKVARLGEPVGSDGPQVGQNEAARCEHLEGVAPAPTRLRRGSVGADGEAQIAREDHDLPGRHAKPAQFRGHEQHAQLRHDEQLSIRVAERPIGHRRIARVDVDGDALLQARVACAADGLQPVCEVDLG